MMTDVEPEPARQVLKYLSPRQRRVLTFIERHVEEHGFPPSYREIADGVGLTSTSSVSHVLERLQKAGWLRHRPGSPRAVQTVSEDRGALLVAWMCGRGEHV